MVSVGCGMGRAHTPYYSPTACLLTADRLDRLHTYYTLTAHLLHTNYTLTERPLITYYELATNPMRTHSTLTTH